VAVVLELTASGRLLDPARQHSASPVSGHDPSGIVLVLIGVRIPRLVDIAERHPRLGSNDALLPTAFDCVGIDAERDADTAKRTVSPEQPSNLHRQSNL
jgi:hypothetical protein